MGDRTLNWKDIPLPHKQLEEADKALSMSIDERNKYLNGEWKPEITWTNCAAAIPPDKPGNPVIVKLGNGSVEKVSSRWLLNVLIPKLGKDKLEWTPYTPEKWKELNK